MFGSIHISSPRRLFDLSIPSQSDVTALHRAAYLATALILSTEASRAPGGRPDRRSRATSPDHGSSYLRVMAWLTPGGPSGVVEQISTRALGLGCRSVHQLSLGGPCIVSEKKCHLPRLRDLLARCFCGTMWNQPGGFGDVFMGLRTNIWIGPGKLKDSEFSSKMPGLASVSVDPRIPSFHSSFPIPSTQIPLSSTRVLTPVPTPHMAAPFRAPGARGRRCSPGDFSANVPSASMTCTVRRSCATRPQGPGSRSLESPPHRPLDSFLG